MNNLFFKQVDAISIAVFRIGFGAILLFECVNYGVFLCPECLYLESDLLFKYQYFEWVAPLPGKGLRILWLIMAVTAVMIMLGYFYRYAILFFTVAFTYMFLLDQSEYLNHFYMVILFCVLMFFIPANKYLSLDARVKPESASSTLPYWTLLLLGAQLEIILIWAGIVKLNGDWLQLEPLRMWLTARSQNSAEIFQVLTQDWGIAIAAYGVLLLHLVGAPLLLWKKARLWILMIYAMFHICNSLVFNIGIFPWLTFWATLLLFDPDWPRQFWRFVQPQYRDSTVEPHRSGIVSSEKKGIIVALVLAWIFFQIVIPMRNWWLPGNVAWNEAGHRFSWRMKLRSKNGNAIFIATDNTGKEWRIDPAEHLTYKQHRKMTCIPDMLWQFAQFVEQDLSSQGVEVVSVNADVMCSLNGREPARLVNRDINLVSINRSEPTENWLLPLNVSLR